MGAGTSNTRTYTHTHTFYVLVSLPPLHILRHLIQCLAAKTSTRALTHTHSLHAHIYTHTLFPTHANAHFSQSLFRERADHVIVGPRLEKDESVVISNLAAENFSFDISIFDNFFSFSMFSRFF